MTKMLTIKNLKNCPHHFDTLALWHHNQWSHLYPDETLIIRKQHMLPYLNNNFIPSTFIAVDDNDTLLGSAAIIDSDMETHPDFTPWLASVFVSPNYRQQGIGQTLISHIITLAKVKQFENLYLFTPDQQCFYNRRGWVIHSEEIYHGEDVTIMRHPLK